MFVNMFPDAWKFALKLHITEPWISGKAIIASCS